MLGFSVVAGDNDHFRRQLVLEVVRAGQAVGDVHHLVTRAYLPPSLSD